MDSEIGPSVFKRRHCPQQCDLTSLDPSVLICKVPPSESYGDNDLCREVAHGNLLTLTFALVSDLVLLAASDRAPASLTPSPYLTSSSAMIPPLLSPCGVSSPP